MWISRDLYKELRDSEKETRKEAQRLEKDINTLIRIFSGVVVAQGGSITIPLPSKDHRSLAWRNSPDGTITITSEVMGSFDGDIRTSDT